MENFIGALEIVLPMCILMGVGFGLKRASFFDARTTQNINKLVSNVTLPCLMFYNTYRSDFRTAFRPDLFIYTGAAVLITFLAALFLVPLFVKQNARRGVIIHALFRGNTSIYGIPLAQGIVGAAADITDLMAVMSLTVILYNVLGVITLQVFSGAKTSPGKILLGILKAPMVVGGLLGLVFTLAAIPLPAPLLAPVSSLGAITTPLAFLSLGSSFVFRKSERSRSVAVVVLVRLVLIPLVWLGAGIGLFGFAGSAVATLMAVFATPSAVNTYPLASAAGLDSELAGDIVVYTTVFSLASLFMITFALKSMGVI